MVVSCELEEPATQVDDLPDDVVAVNPDAVGEDADTGEVIVLFPELHGVGSSESRAMLAELREENQRLRHELDAARDFNSEAALAREREFMRMREELALRGREADQLRAEVESAEGRLRDAVERARQAAAREVARDAELADARADLGALRGQLEELVAELEASEARTKGAVERATARDVELAEAEATARDLRADIARLEHGARIAEEHISFVEGERDQAIEARGELARALDERDAELAAALDWGDRALDELTRSRDEHLTALELLELEHEQALRLSDLRAAKALAAQYLALAGAAHR